MLLDQHLCHKASYLPISEYNAFYPENLKKFPRGGEGGFEIFVLYEKKP